MGTNFYYKKNVHIGKRSAAGFYCWDCNITLCKNGNNSIHQSESKWHEKCPKCGKSYLDEGFNSSVGRELGFNKSPYGKKVGVRSCSSFTWAIEKGKIKFRKITDEYGRQFSRKEFEKILEECPVQFYDNIGKSFS
jgi:hypothetical protein